MVHRIALASGAVAAVALLALALGQGSLFAQSQQTSNAAAPTAVAVVPTPGTQIDTVYIKPAPTPQVIHVTRTNPPAPRPTQRVVVINRPSHRHEDDGSRGDHGRGEQGDD